MSGHHRRCFYYLCWPLFLCFVLIAAACTPQAETPVVIVLPDSERLFATATPTLEPIVVSQVTRLPTLTPSPTATATPTEIPSPTPTPTDVPCLEPGRVERHSYASRTGLSERPYSIYLPPCYGRDGRRYPVLYMLHGNVRFDDEWIVLGLDQAAEEMIVSAEIPPMIIVMPNGGSISSTSSGGPNSYESVLIDDMLPHIEATWCVSSQRTQKAIGGLSRGGYWAFEIAFRHPELFGSVGGHSAAFLDNGNDVTINPIYTVSRNDISDLRITFDYGADDYTLNTGRPLHNDLLARGIEHQWIVHDSGGHNDDYWSLQVNDHLRWYAEPWSFERNTYANCELADSDS